MSEAEQLILEQLKSMNQNFTKLHQDVTELRQDFTGLRQEVTKLRQDFTELSQKVDKLAKDSARTQLLIENDISKKIDIIGEGHDFLKMRLNDALKMEMARESMELRLINQKMEIDKIKQHIGIA